MNTLHFLSVATVIYLFSKWKCNLLAILYIIAEIPSWQSGVSSFFSMLSYVVKFRVMPILLLPVTHLTQHEHNVMLRYFILGYFIVFNLKLNFLLSYQCKYLRMQCTIQLTSVIEYLSLRLQRQMFLYCRVKCNGATFVCLIGFLTTYFSRSLLQIKEY